MKHNLFKLSIVLAALFFFSCGAKKEEKTQETTSQTSNQESLEVKFELDNFSEEPMQTRIFVLINGKKHEVCVESAAEVISVADAKVYQVPENALAAVSGFWGGAGFYMYAISEDGKIKIFQARHYEEDAPNTPIKYEVIKTFEAK
jgi:hypothetical protein